MGIARTNRLSAAGYKEVFREGKVIRKRSVTIRFLDSSPSTDIEDGGPYFGTTVGKGVGGAVVRNKVRRRIKEVLRIKKDSLRGRIVVSANRSSHTPSFSKLFSEIGLKEGALR